MERVLQMSDEEIQELIKKVELPTLLVALASQWLLAVRIQQEEKWGTQNDLDYLFQLLIDCLNDVVKIKIINFVFL